MTKIAASPRLAPSTVTPAQALGGFGIGVASNLSKDTRSALGREGAKAAARKRGASKGTGTGAGAMTVRAVGQKRRSH